MILAFGYGLGFLLLSLLYLQGEWYLPPSRKENIRKVRNPEPSPSKEWFFSLNHNFHFPSRETAERKDQNILLLGQVGQDRGEWVGAKMPVWCSQTSVRFGGIPRVKENLDSLGEDRVPETCALSRGDRPWYCFLSVSILGSGLSSVPDSSEGCAEPSPRNMSNGKVY